MFNVLDKYIGKVILGSIMMTLFMLLSLSGIIRFVEQLRRVGQGSYDIFNAGIYTLLTIPKEVEIFFPIAALLGALMGLGGLATRSELVAMEAAGYTRLRIAVAVMKTAVPIALLTMVMGEWVTPKSEQTAREMRAQKLYGHSLLSINSGIWAKDGNDFVYIGRISETADLTNINIYKFDEKQNLHYVITAASGSFNHELQQWSLYQVSETNLQDEKQVQLKNLISFDWKTPLTPDKLGVVALSPDSLSISRLYDYTQYLKRTGQESNRYKLIMWSKIFSPISLAVMILMALSFVFGPLRSVSMGVRIITGVAGGFAFYILDAVFGPVSLVYGMPPVLSALLPSFIFITISTYLLKRKV